jgi:antitoxin component YwqK of YwqJK toxin-antitoxin module
MSFQHNRTRVFLLAGLFAFALCGLSRAEERKGYYPDGKIKWEANYENNVPSGTGKSYSPDGVLIQETTYSNNGKDQSKKIYYKDGSLFQEVQSVGGRLTGDWKVYHPNGRLAHVKSYDQDGVKISEQYFDEQGKVVIDGLWQGHNQKGEITGPFRLKNGVREDGF